MVREMVGAAHAKPDRVRELLRESPRLANASWDWGFGDWETALGAASHVGNPEIAEMLLAAGARADLFTHAMLGHIDVVRATIIAMPGIERVRGPHGLTLAHHARQGEATAVIEYLKTLPGADIPYTNLPLTPEQQQPYLGIYRYGDGPTQTFEVLVQKSTGSLGIQRRRRLAAAAPQPGRSCLPPARLGGNTNHLHRRVGQSNALSDQQVRAVRCLGFGPTDGIFSVARSSAT